MRSSQRDFVQTDILDRCPDDGEATGLGREHVNLIGTLPYVAEQTLVKHMGEPKNPRHCFHLLKKGAE